MNEQTKMIRTNGARPWFRQDDCAPDALEYFLKDFLRKVGMSFREWCKLATVTHYDDGYYSQYVHGDVLVTIEAGDPFYSVYKISDLHRSPKETDPPRAGGENG